MTTTPSASFPFAAPPPSLNRTDISYSPPASLSNLCSPFGDQFFNPCQPKTFFAPDPSSLPPSNHYIVLVADLAQPF